MSDSFLSPFALVVCLTLVSCEGATYLNHHLTNHTADTLQVGYRSDESASGWQVDTVWTLAPGETHVHYAVDFWGKCHDCTPYEVLPYGPIARSRWTSSILPSGKCMWTKGFRGFALTSSSTSYLPTLSDPILLNSIS